MYVRQFKTKDYKCFRERLIKKAYQNPLEASYNVEIEVAEEEYLLKVQPCRGHRMAVLQALRVERDKKRQSYILITDDGALMSLFNLLVYQYTERLDCMQSYEENS